MSLSPPPAEPPPPPLPVPVVDQIEVLSPGKGPRRRLRYHPTKPWTLAISAKLHAREKVNTHTAYDVDVPPFAYGLAVTGVDPRNGVVRLQLRGTEATVGRGKGAEVATSFVALFRQLVGSHRAWIEVDPRGVITGAGIVGVVADGDRPAILREMRQLFYSATVPLPDSPIAPGARWRVVSRVERAGVIVKQTAAYHLRAAAGDRLTVDVDVEQVGEAQLVAAQETVDTSADLHAFVWSATGRLTIALSKVTASGALTIDQRVHGGVRVGARVADVYDAATGTLTLSSTW